MSQPVVGLPGVEPVGTYPSEQYFLALEVYRTGDLERAVDLFELALRRTRRDINGRWIDAIPVHAMLAECYWHAGNLPACRVQLDQAFQLAIVNRGWLSRIEWESVLQPNTVRAQPRGLWTEAAAVTVVPTARKIRFVSGEVVTEQRLAQGGTIEQLNIKSLDGIEIMRGLALASYRRRVLLGSLSKQDPVAGELLEATKYPASLSAAIGKSLIGSLRSTGKFSLKDDTRSLSDTQKFSAFQSGAHPLSALSLLTQTSIIAGTDQWQTKALPSARVAANVAAATQQPELIGEALQLAAGCATKKTAASVQQFAKTAAVAMTRESRLASLHCLIAGADAAVTAGDLSGADQMIRQAQTLSSRRDVIQPRLDAYGAYVSARLAAAQGESMGLEQNTLVDKSLASISTFAFQRKFQGRPVPSMARLYQSQLLIGNLGASAGGGGSDRLVEEYCTRVPAEVWRRDPVEGIAASAADRTTILMAWLRNAISDSDGRVFLQRLDHVLSHRFLGTQRLGGRLVQVRQLASASDAILPEPGKTFLTNAPESVLNLRRATAQPVPADLDGAMKQAGTQESTVTQIAMERLEIPRVVPAPLPKEALADRLPVGTTMVTLTYVGNQLIGTLTAQGQTEIWSVGGASRLKVDLGNLLKKIGVGRIRGKRLPEDDGWTLEAAKIQQRLFPDAVASLLADSNRVLVVPDGLLWSLPFELLPVPDESGESWADRFEVRYAPTPGSAVRPVAPPAISRTVGIAANKFFVPKDDKSNESALADILDRLPDHRRLRSSGSLPGSLLGDALGTLCVAAARGVDPADPLGFRVAAYDAGSIMGSLRAWIRLPAATPRVVVLSGFRSSVDSGQSSNGQDMFMTVCGLHASGVRDVMLSRWAVGGKSTATMLSELLPEIGHSGLPGAWKRTRAVLGETEIDPSGEPLLTQAEHDREGVTGKLPLFWSGYLMVAPIDLDAEAP